jgi:hypothetical protein
VLQDASLYDTAGHATGSLDIRIDLIRYQRDTDAWIEGDIAELWRIMKTLENVGNWASVNRCLLAIIDINTWYLRTPSTSLQTKVEDEWLRVADQKTDFHMTAVLLHEASTIMWAHGTGYNVPRPGATRTCLAWVSPYPKP